MKILSGLILLMIPFSLLSQKAPIKWKEIPMEDLQMSTYELEPTAPAAVLCDYGQIYFNTNPNGSTVFVFYERHVRIKILKPEGLKYATISIPFRDMACEQVSNNSIALKIMVYNLSEKGKVIATKIKNKDIIYRDSTNCMRVAEFSCSEAKTGSIIEYTYQMPTLDFLQPKSWYFQRDIPVRYSELRMKVPRAIQYMFSSPNISDFDVLEESDYMTFTNNSRYTNISGIQMRFVKKNVESFKNEKFISNTEDFVQKINIHLKFAKWDDYNIYQLALSTDDEYDTYEPGQRKNINSAGFIIYKLPDWEKLNENLLQSERFGRPLLNFWEYQIPLNQMTKNSITPEDKMIAIYDYLRKNMKWTGEYNTKVKAVFPSQLSKIYTKVTKKVIKEKSLAKPFEDKKGSSSEINFLLIYFLNRAGIKTYPVIISTRDHGKIDENIPEIKQFNNVLAYVDLGENQLLLDATDSLRPYQYLDKNDLNSVGYLHRGKDFGWIKIVNSRIPESNIAESISIDENSNITRKTTISDNIYDEIEHRKKITLEGKDKFLTEYITQFSGINRDSQTDIKNFENDSLPLLVTLLKKSQLPENEEIKIQTNFVPAYTPQDFTDLERKCPVDFNYPFKQNYFLQIDVPEEYDVKLPENEEITLYGNHATYTYSANLTGNKIMVKINLQILLNEFPNHEYQNLKLLFTKLDEKLKESIILRKSYAINN